MRRKNAPVSRPRAPFTIVPAMRSLAHVESLLASREMRRAFTAPTGPILDRRVDEVLGGDAGALSGV